MEVGPGVAEVDEGPVIPLKDLSKCFLIMALELFSPNTKTSSCLGVFIGGSLPLLIPTVARVIEAKRLVRNEALVDTEDLSFRRCLRDNDFGAS